jgi:hypothetical protein
MIERSCCWSPEMIQKSREQDIDREGRRLLRQALEPLGWVITGFEEDYSIDYDVQVFVDGSPDGVWFKIQLKSSASSDYSADGSFISQQLSLDHARHYAMELREPIFLVHADVRGETLFWHAPQLDNALIGRLEEGSASTSITVRIPTSNTLPARAQSLMQAVERLYLVLANRTLANAPISSFAESLKYQPGESKLRQEYQLKNDVLKLRRVAELTASRQFIEARSRARVVASDPDSSIENRFWAEVQIGNIDWSEAATESRPQAELPLIYLNNAKVLQALAKSGPAHLKFFALITRKAAELDQLVQNNWGLTILFRQQLERAGNPLMALNYYAAHAASTRHIISKYNQCLRLAKYASDFNGRWILPRALLRIVQAAASFVLRLGFIGMEGATDQFHSSILQISKLIAWIAQESGDDEEIALAVGSALLPIRSQETDAFKWAVTALDRINDPTMKKQATQLMERQILRWRGGALETDSYRGNPIQQIVENAASTLGIDLSDDKNPIVQGLRIAVKDNTPARVLETCEHIITSMGATGPAAREIRMLFGIETAGSKIVHCTLHNYHHEAKDLDSAFVEFKSRYCNSCPDRSPRPAEWKYTEAFQEELNAKHLQFVRYFNAKGSGYRFTSFD